MKKFSVTISGWWLVGAAILVAGALKAFDLQDTDKGAQLLTNPSIITGTAQGQLWQTMPPYCVDVQSSALTYVCYSSTTGSQLIKRIQTVGSTNIFMTKATGTWANRASLTYTGIND